jgi:hypothetical protein
MKRIFVLASLVLAASAYAHDEGHGPKLSDSPKQGGVIAPVIDSKEVAKGSKAKLLHKSELVRAEDGTVRVYFYDQEMNPLDLSKLAPEAKAVVEFKKSKKDKKWTKTPFSLKQEEGAYVGKAPKVASKPFNIDVKVKEGDRELLTAFDNLD